jgi:hypothetical protein
MFPRSFKLTALLLLPLVAGCSGIFDPDYNDERSYERALDRWYAVNAYEYEITVDRRCDCLYRGPIRMLVRNGIPVAAVDRYTGVSIPYNQLRYYPSVEELFDLIDDALYGSRTRVAVSYDNSYGYPRTAHLDYDRYDSYEDVRFEMRELRLIR